MPICEHCAMINGLHLPGCPNGRSLAKEVNETLDGAYKAVHAMVEERDDLRQRLSDMCDMYRKANEEREYAIKALQRIAKYGCENTSIKGTCLELEYYARRCYPCIATQALGYLGVKVDEEGEEETQEAPEIKTCDVCGRELSNNHAFIAPVGNPSLRICGVDFGCYEWRTKINLMEASPCFSLHSYPEYIAYMRRLWQRQNSSEEQKENRDG